MMEQKKRLITIAALLTLMVPSAMAGTAVPNSYKVTIKELSLCEDLDCTTKTTLFSGARTIDMANLNKREVQELVPATATVAKGAYNYILLVLQNRILMKGSAALGTGQYCSTDNNASRSSIPTTQNYRGMLLLTNITTSPNATQEGEFWLPNGTWSGSNWRMSVNDASTSGELSIVLSLGSTIDVPQDVKIADVADLISIYFDVDSGVETYDEGGGNCSVYVGAPKLYFKIGGNLLVNGAQPQIDTQ